MRDGGRGWKRRREEGERGRGREGKGGEGRGREGLVRHVLDLLDTHSPGKGSKGFDIFAFCDSEPEHEADAYLLSRLEKNVPSTLL